MAKKWYKSKLFIISCSFLVFLVSAALIIPHFIKLSDYKELIATKVSEAIGRKVSLNGDISLTLLPMPRIVIKEVAVANITDAHAPYFAQVNEVSVRIAFWPLFKRQIHVVAVNLEKALLNLEALPDGRKNWDFALADKKSDSASFFQVAVDELSLSNAQISYTDAKEKYAATDLNATITLESLTGPYKIKSSFKAVSKDFSLNALLSLDETKINYDLKVSIDKNDLEIKGDYNKAAQLAKGALNFAGNLKLAQAFKAQLTIPAQLKEDIAFSTSYEADLLQKLLKLEQIKFDVKEANINGKLFVGWKADLKVIANFSNLPGKGAIAVDMIKHDAAIKGKVTLDLNDPKILLNWLKIASTSLPATIKQIKFKSDFVYEKSVSLTNLTAAVGDAQLNGSVQWFENKNIHNLSVDLASPHIEKVLAVLGQKSPGPNFVGSASIVGQLNGSSDNFSISKLALFIGGAQINGQISVAKKQSEYSGAINLQSPRMENIFALIGQKLPSPLLKGAFAVNGSLSANGKQFSASPLNINFASGFSARGSLKADLSQAKPKINANLALSPLSMEMLSDGSASSPPQTASSERWSSAPIDLSFLKKLDARLEITTPRFTRKDLIITNPKINAQLENGVLSVSELSGGIFGGSLKANAQINDNGSYKIASTLNNAQVKSLAPQDGKLKIVEGILNLALDLNTQGRSVRELVNHLGGSFTFNAKDGAINGFNLEAIAQRLSNINNVESILGAIQTALAGGKTPFNFYNGDLRFSQGVARIQSMTLATSRAKASATGNINLPNYTMDVTTTVSVVNPPNLPTIGLRFYGPIDNPSRSYDLASLRDYLLKNVVLPIIKDLTSGKAPNFLNLLKGK